MSKKKWFPYLLILPSFLLIAVFVAYPILDSVIRSFKDSQTGAFTFDNYLYFFQDEIQRENIFYTLKVVLWTVIWTAVVSFLLALFLRFSDSKFAKWMGYLVLIPRFVPGMVAVYAVILMIKDAGVISRIAKLFGVDFNLGWMYQPKGIIITNLWFNIPFSTLMILAALSNVKDAHIESIRDVGGNWWNILKSLILPMTYKDILMSMTFVFMGNIGSFTTPFLMGGNHPKMLGIALYDQFNTYMNYERASALSVIMFLFSLGAALVYIWANMKEEAWESEE